jgi:hypothetical protein
MNLLIDSDAVCKLAVGGVLEMALAICGSSIQQSARLPALVPMLQRGRLRIHYGDGHADKILAYVSQMQIAPAPETSVADLFVGLHEVDPGEALLLATSIERGLPVITGDKRALATVSTVPGLCARLDGRIAAIEQVCLGLCIKHGDESIRQRMAAVLPFDKTLRVCFAEGNPNPVVALESYLRSLERDVSPLRLWDLTAST